MPREPPNTAHTLSIWDGEPQTRKTRLQGPTLPTGLSPSHHGGYHKPKRLPKPPAAGLEPGRAEAPRAPRQHVTSARRRQWAGATGATPSADASVGGRGQGRQRRDATAGGKGPRCMLVLVVSVPAEGRGSGAVGEVGAALQSVGPGLRLCQHPGRWMFRRKIRTMPAWDTGTTALGPGMDSPGCVWLRPEVLP